MNKDEIETRIEELLTKREEALAAGLTIKAIEAELVDLKSGTVDADGPDDLEGMKRAELDALAVEMELANDASHSRDKYSNIDKVKEAIREARASKTE